MFPAFVIKIIEPIPTISTKKVAPTFMIMPKI